MSQIQVGGIYRDGRVELDERPDGVGDPARVVVTFLDPEVHRDEAARNLIAFLEEHHHLGGGPYPRREEIYDRVNRLIDRLDRRDG